MPKSVKDLGYSLCTVNLQRCGESHTCVYVATSVTCCLSLNAQVRKYFVSPYQIISRKN